MKLRLKLAVGGLALTGALLGGGAAAMAQSATTTTPSTTAPSTTAPATGSTPHKPDSRNCPNMGSDSGTGSSTAPAAPSA